MGNSIAIMVWFVILINQNRLLKVMLSCCISFFIFPHASVTATLDFNRHKHKKMVTKGYLKEILRTAWLK
ncbi:hypothetical protein CXF72_07455 [Psychromonas sp. MB-3u-54]|nr:hypothetical protein CXF72_07455 [Psychromonas sp. MB-3u-54]